MERYQALKEARNWMFVMGLLIGSLVTTCVFMLFGC